MVGAILQAAYRIMQRAGKECSRQKKENAKVPSGGNTSYVSGSKKTLMTVAYTEQSKTNKHQKKKMMVGDEVVRRQAMQGLKRSFDFILSAVGIQQRIFKQGSQ